MRSPEVVAVPEGPPRLLLVEDSPSDAMLMKAALGDSVLATAQVERVTSLTAALVTLAKNTFDAVIVDLGLPDSDGIDTFLRISAAARHAAVVVITGLEDERLGEQAVRLGAQDFLYKGERHRGEFGRALDYAIRRQQVTDELDRARRQQLEAKDRFLSHVSHELRSPLAVVHQFASLLQDGIAGPLLSDQQDFLDVLMRNVDQLRMMIDDLLEVTRAQRGQVAINSRAVDVGLVLADTVAGYQPEATRQGITLTVDCGAELPRAFADAQRVHEVVGNLIDNALKFTASPGTITVTAAAEDDCIRVRVEDTGRGISPEDQSHIFEQFYQVNQGDEAGRSGLGIGLFLGRQLIQRQGGRMWVQSTLGRGTAVYFTLPLVGRQPPGRADDHGRAGPPATEPAGTNEESR